MKIRALALALALTLAAPATPALAAPASPGPAVVTVHVGWLRAQRLMDRGWWCERTAPGRFTCTRPLDPYAIIGPVTSLGDLRWFLFHGFACAGETWHPVPQWWDCTPG